MMGVWVLKRLCFIIHPLQGEGSREGFEGGWGTSQLCCDHELCFLALGLIPVGEVHFCCHLQSQNK